MAALGAGRSLHRWTAWAGGPVILLLILLAQIVFVAMMALDPRVPFVLAIAVPSVLLILRRPVVGIGLLLAARLLSTGATVFYRVGSIGIGPYEPMIVLSMGSLAVYAMIYRTPLWRTWSWRGPYLALMAWVILSFGWAVDRGDAVSELLPMILVVANTLVILTFVRTWDDFRLMLLFWVGTCVLIGLIAIVTDVLGIQIGVSFQAAAGGGRETGLGQQPNWFAMNLMFIIHPCFGMALLEKRRLQRFGLVLAGFFIFVMMLKAGSRGGAYATLIGGVLAALAHPLFRRWFLRFAVGTALVFGIGIATNLGGVASALSRISSQVGLGQNFRELNWIVCLEMFRDTWGRGIGAGGYETLLPTYDNYVANSLYDYPHGIFWQLIAHYGVVGLIIMAWLLIAVARMTRRMTLACKGTEAEVFAWTMPAAMLGYVAWSFAEFTLNDKPFWEFLALYTALGFVVERARAEGRPLPGWSAPLRLSAGDPEAGP